MAEKIRELSISILLSSRIKDYDKIEEEGGKKRNNCAFFNGKNCERIRVSHKERILVSWYSDNTFLPHPILCYICPYYSSRRENYSKINLDLFELYSYYYTLKEKLERELIMLDSKVRDFVISNSLLFKRRREELIVILEEIKRKLNVTFELIKLQQSLYE
jgi:hypothetical protein